MKIIKHPDNTININATIETLLPGESITLKEEQSKVDYVRCQTSKIAKRHGWVISVANSTSLKGKILISRKS